MAYESRIFIVNRIDDLYAEKIADIKMASMYDGFTDLFNKEIDYELYVDNGDETTRTDCYGKTMTYTDCKTVIDYLEKQIANGETYRRLSLLLGLLRGINEEQWEDIHIVHYGY